MKARVTVTLKAGVLDPQGKAIEGALASLGIAGVASVRQGKLFDIELSDGNDARADTALRDACERLLANTVIEDYRIEIVAASVRAVPPPLPTAALAEVAAQDTGIPTEGHP